MNGNSRDKSHSLSSTNSVVTPTLEKATLSSPEELKRRVSIKIHIFLSMKEEAYPGK